MSDKLTTQEENGEKVFTVELEPGSEITMTTADTYVDKNIRVKAKSVDPITYTGGTGIDVDNDTHTISVDDTVVTVSKLASGELQAIDLDPKSSHVVSQIVTTFDGFIGPAYTLYLTDSEGALDPNSYGTFGAQIDGLDYPIVAMTADRENAHLVLSSYQERPYYFVIDGDSGFQGIALQSDFSGTVADGKWTSLTINGVTANIPQGGGGGGEPDAYIKNASVSGKTLTLTKKDNTTVTFADTNTEYTQGAGIKITGTEISADDAVVATKTDLQDKINRDEAEETIVSILTAMHLNRYYTGAAVPQSSLGQDGDIYLQE